MKQKQTVKAIFDLKREKKCLTAMIILTKILLKVALNTINQPKFLTLVS